MTMKKFLMDFIPEVYTKNEESLRKARLFVLVCFLTSFFSAFYLLSSIYFNMPHAAYAMAFNVVGFLIIPFLFRYKFISLYWTANLYVLIGAIGVGVVTLYTGGLHSSILPWFAVLPITSLMLTNKKSAWFWTITSYVLVTVIGVLAFQKFNFIDESGSSMIAIFNTMNLNGLVLLIFLITLVFENTKNTALQRLDEKNVLLAKEKHKSEELLLNILPYDVSEELKAFGQTKARSFDSTSVLFTDFVGFTHIAQTLSPQELVDELHECFTAFDEIAHKYNIEKIKTIGDAYMAVSGLPHENAEHAYDMVSAAIEIREFMADRAKKKAKTFAIRIGVHSGGVVAGVVGIKKFSYDIWGDTVNTAARMEQNSEGGKINISETTYNLIKDKFDCAYRGELEAKNKGKLKMYYVNNIFGV